MMVSGDVLFPFEADLDPASLRGVAVQRIAARGPRIEEQYALDENGIVAITIKNLDAGFERVYRLGAGGA